jgi:hypothetical protein
MVNKVNEKIFDFVDTMTFDILKKEDIKEEHKPINLIEWINEVNDRLDKKYYEEKEKEDEEILKKFWSTSL